MPEISTKPVEEMSYKEASDELQQVVSTLESGSLDVEYQLKVFTRGMELLNYLQKRLSEAETKVQLLTSQVSSTVNNQA